MPPIIFNGLLLRAYLDSDLPSVLAATRESMETVGRWMPWCHADYAEADVQGWFENCRSELAAGTAHEFGVFSQADGAFLGGAGLNLINQQHRYGNLGYWVRQSAQRQGVALRSVLALLPHAFNELGLQRVEIVVAQGNLASEGVARKAGALFECRARNRLYIHGQSVPASIFSLVPESSRERINGNST